MESLPFNIAGCCEAGANLSRLRAHGWVHPGQGANPLQANNLLLAYGWFSVARWPNLYVFGLWKESGVLRGNPHRKNMQTFYRKVPLGDLGISPKTFML